MGRECQPNKGPYNSCMTHHCWAISCFPKCVHPGLLNLFGQPNDGSKNQKVKMVTYCMSLHFYTLVTGPCQSWSQNCLRSCDEIQRKKLSMPCEMHFEENAARFPPHPAAPLGVLTGALVAAPLQPGDWNATWQPETMMIRCPSRKTI